MKQEILGRFEAQLVREERAAATVEKYVRNIRRFLSWLGERELSQEAVLAYKADLAGAASTRNGVICAVNAYLRFLGREEWRLRLVKAQRRLYRSQGRCLTKAEYQRLVRTAEARGKERLARAIETIAASGMRVSELQFLTVESLRRGEITIRNKGKLRVILLPASLVKHLRRYCRGAGLDRGQIFVSRRGAGLSRTQLWAEMKALCSQAGVAPSKVFPHNLRHLFAVVHYQIHRDLSKLADLLGHASIDTTRLYLIDSGEAHLRQLEAMRMVLSQEELVINN